MDLRQVEYAVAVVDHGGFTRAAAALHIAQPSLSQSVKRLEEELGAPLFLRIGRTVELSEAGMAFVGPARQLLRGAENVKAAVTAHARLATGTLDLVALPTLVADPLATMVGRFRRHHPAIAIRVTEPTGPAHLLDMVWDGRCEIGVTEAGPPRDGITSRAIHSQELMAVLPPDTPRPKRRLSLAALAEVPVILGPPGTSTRELVESAVNDVGRTLDVAVETSQREAIVPLVLAGAGATVLPAPMAAEAADLGAVVIGFAPSLIRPLAIVHRAAGLSPAAHAFLMTLEQ